MDVHGRDLRYFVAVAEQLNFTAAAERLHVSQPALSKQIRKLESQLGAALFVRDTRSVALTPVGAALLPEARAVLAALAAAESAVDAAKAAQRAVLSIGISTSPGRGILPAVRSRFASAFPDAKPVLRQFGWEDPTAGLAAGETDVAFVWLPLADSDRYRWLVVANEPRLLALPAAHPLAARASIDFTELLDEPFLALPPAAGVLRDYWLALDARAGRPPVIGAEVASTEETYEALVNGDGVVLLATGNAALVAHEGVVTRPVTGLRPCELALAWHRDDTRPLVHGYARACAQVASAR
ncbi:LysR family transcriptional regulator [Nocardia neocaledoniensis NBRC 108232]|uniref:LysR family transcriptional regulator n=1 Tax=Nocardia neocaledoniensis TaxID=236511 RepID=A0A317N7J3_9NOCA|nr:LysR family transcriptional regulator [Nocardia neocaledoniensis]PWV70687.1 LysR family transcriptional regulator [Nocardia neocaledoniensis]GEM32343.1 LysR family transcriptional regulator [Nocardia neocaledoniensis NBRC 108232]